MPDTASMTMSQLLARYPWARRALFQKFHIGGCASCGFSDEETLDAVCARSGGVPVDEVLAAVHAAHEQDETTLLDPVEAKRQLERFTVVDIRSREEFDAVRLPGAVHFDQRLLDEAMNHWDRARPVLIVDHLGQRGLDAAAYFAGHGFTQVRCLRGGIDAYSRDADPALPRYELE